MLLAVESYAFADNLEAVIDRLGDSENFEIADGKIAKQVKVVHLTIGIEKGVFGIVTSGGRSDHHPGRVEALLPGDAGRAGGSP